MSTTEILIALLGLGFGGFLKGATGAGAPVVGVPVLALVFNVPMAVAVFSVLNLLSNIWQSWSYRRHRGRSAFVFSFAVAGALGAVAGSVLLASLSTDLLMGGLAVVVFAYIALRLARPDWGLERMRGERLAPVAGVVGGLMQGAGGISAPVSVTYLNAMQLSREEFVATISVFFAAMSILQIPSLVALGVLTFDRLLFSFVAAIPIFAAMPLGEWAARRVSKQLFDRIILVLLGVIATRLIWVALS